MDSIHIHGKIPLQGHVKIQGSKNAALPIMAATLLIDGCCELQNCPRITDVFCMQTLLKSLGCRISREADKLKICADTVLAGILPKEEMTEMRSSIILLGAMLARFGEAQMIYPGGCVIGDRPIDIHKEALEKMGVSFEEGELGFFAKAEKLTGANVKLRFPSVGATENLLLAASCAKGETVIENAAIEPEIVALCEFLIASGVPIQGCGSKVLRIQGIEKPKAVKYKIPADRIVAGTYAIGGLITGGSMLLEDAPVKQMQALKDVIVQPGIIWQEAPEGLYLQVQRPFQAPKKVCTRVYPGFPTDLQSPFLAALATAKGESIVEENIFEKRFRIVDALRRMGADINCDEHTACVRGVEYLKGQEVEAEELRGGAALVLAGLGAEGETVVKNCHYIYRGYENLGKDLRELGARIYSV